MGSDHCDYAGTPARVVMLGRLLGILALSTVAVAGPPGTPHTFDSNGVPISFVDSGRGSPVVLIHGFTGSAARHFDGTGVVAAIERAGHRVVALDCRGHGRSGKPLDSARYGLEMVGDVIRLLDHLRIARAHIIGYSMGGGIAQQILVKYPTRAITVTLLGSGWQGEHLPELTAQMNALADGFDRGDASAMIRGIAADAHGGPSEAEVAAATADLFSRNDPRVLASIARSAPVLWRVSRDDLRDVHIPVLAIDGQYDEENLTAARRMVGVVRDLEFIELPETNHRTSVRAAIPNIVAFLDRYSRGKAQR